MKPGAIILFFLLLIYSQAMAEAQTQLPAEVAINQEAGCGGHLTVTVRLQSGEELPLDVDTGSPITILDESLESKLGKRLGTVKTSNWGAKQTSDVYAAPKLYLGNTLLMTGPGVLTSSFKKLAPREHTLGVLGMDCLAHYCIQLDFAAGKMRFLSPGQIEAGQPGEAFPLVFSSIGQGNDRYFRTFIHHPGLIGGGEADLLIDTGLDIDGALEPEIIEQQELQLPGQDLRKLNKTTWCFRECVWEGQTYTNIIVTEAGKDGNVLGLRFLARHLVTFDFPDRVMYLQRETAGPLPNDLILHNDAQMNSLIFTGDQLPADAQARLNAVLDKRSLPLRFRLFGGTITVKKDGDATSFHYTVFRKSRHDPWQIKKAWCTDQYGQTIKNYTIP
jgi:hypothetical protein